MNIRDITTIKVFSQSLIKDLQEATSSNDKLHKFINDCLEDVLITTSYSTGEILGLLCILKEDNKSFFTQIDILYKEIEIDREWIIEVDEGKLTNLIDPFFTFNDAVNGDDGIDWERIIDYFRG